MKHNEKLAVGLAFLVILIFTSLAFAQTSPNFEVLLSRFASGGGLRVSENYLAQDILGQWISESPASIHAQIITNFFWTGVGNPQQLYLPVITRH